MKIWALYSNRIFVLREMRPPEMIYSVRALSIYAFLVIPGNWGSVFCYFQSFIVVYFAN